MAHEFSRPEEPLVGLEEPCELCGKREGEYSIGPNWVCKKCLPRCAECNERIDDDSDRWVCCKCSGDWCGDCLWQTSERDIDSYEGPCPYCYESDSESESEEEEDVFDEEEELQYQAWLTKVNNDRNQPGAVAYGVCGPARFLKRWGKEQDDDSDEEE